MNFLLELDKDIPTLAISEALAVGHAIEYKIDENIVTFEHSDAKPETIVQRLSLTRTVYKHLFTTTRKKIDETIQKHEWSVKEPIKVETRNTTEEERKKLITTTCKALKNPKVNMNTPATRIMYIYTKKKAHCGIFIGEPVQDTSRAMSKLPAPHPSAMKPRIVKAIINIAQPTKSILDPFCGAGGFLAEAATLRIPVEGWDIDRGMIWRAKKNTKEYKNVTIKQKDARTLKTADAIISDLPYGRNTKKQDMTKLYKEFFQILKKARYNKAVIVLPKQANPVTLAKKEGLNVLRKHELYVHGSLTRIIIEISGTNTFRYV